MSDECKPIDPTAFGLFFVALVSLPIALACIFSYAGIENDITKGSNLGGLLMLAAFFILIASLKAYKAESNFGFIVFAWSHSVCSMPGGSAETCTSTSLWASCT